MPRCIRLSALAVVLLAAAACDEQKQAKLVGAWRLVRSEQLPPGSVTTWVFNSDGTATTTLAQPNGKDQFFNRTWRVSSATLTTVTRSANAETTDEATIVRLTDTSLVTRDKGGREEEFVRLR